MSEPNQLLHVSTTLSRGGAENHVAELVRHQRSQGKPVCVAFLRGSGTWTAELVRLGAEVHNLEMKFYGDLSPLFRLRRLIKQKNPVLIHAHMPPAELYTRLALLGLPARSFPLVITKHNQEPFYPGRFHALIGRVVARRASAVIAISEAVRRYITGPGLGLPAAQIETIPYGIEAKPFSAASDSDAIALRREWNVPDHALLIGFVGRFVPQKSLGTLLKAFALFKASSHDARLALVGTGPLEEMLRRQAEELEIAPNVVWPGFRENIPAVMRAFDIFALSSSYEGLGLVLLEAMAAGRPIVASRTSAIPEVVVDGVTGILVPVGDHDEFARAFARLSDDPALRSRFGEAGRERVMKNFTLEEMHRRTEALYSRVQRDPSVQR